MKTNQSLIPWIKTASKIWMSLLCLTSLFLIASVSSVYAQACPSTYSVYPDPSGSGKLYTSGSDVDVYYQIYRNGYVWDVHYPGTGGFMYWEGLCSGNYTIVTWKEGCAPVTLNNGVPVSIVGSWECPSLSDETNLEISSLHSLASNNRNKATDYAWFINTRNVGNWH